MLDFKPLRNMVAVDVLDKSKVSKGGIILPGGADESEYGIAAYIGPEVTEVQVGDVLLLGPYGGTDTKVDGQKLRLIKEDEILGVVED